MEISNIKLSSGTYTLKDIIARSKSSFVYNNIEELISSNLEINRYATILGYYEKGDSGYSNFIIKEEIQENEYGIELENGFYAVLIPKTKVNIKQFGAKCDGLTDDTEAIQKCINYANSHNLILEGTLNYSLISKTLMIPSPIQINHLYLSASDNTEQFTNNYMIYINTENGSSWINAYNNYTDNKLFDIKLKNETENIINGIKVLSNIELTNIYTYGLNKSIDGYSSSNYIDTIRLENINISYKKGTDFAIITSFLGDCAIINNVHIHDTIGDNKLIQMGSSRNPSSITNIINGYIQCLGGTISIKNYHGEGTNALIDLNDGNFSLDTIYITGNSKPSITLSYANVNIQNFISVYNLDRNYDNDNDIELYNNSNCEIINSYKRIWATEQSASAQIKADIKTNINDLTFTKNQICSNNLRLYKNNISKIIQPLYLSTSIENASYGQWKRQTGTFYYKLRPLYDDTRLIASNYIGDRNITKTLVNMGVTQIQGVPIGVPIRILRGTSENIFTEYVDVISYNTVINDNGEICNGKLWKTLENPVSGTFGDNYNGSISYNGENVIVHSSAIPTSGQWTKGDIIYNSNVSENSPLGWICVESGTPRNLEYVLDKS